MADTVNEPSATWYRQFCFWQRRPHQGHQWAHTHSKLNGKYSTSCLQARGKQWAQYFHIPWLQEPSFLPCFCTILKTTTTYLRVVSSLSQLFFLKQTCIYTVQQQHPSVDPYCCTGFCQWRVCLGCARIIQYWAAHRELSRSSWGGCVWGERLP